MIESYKEYKEYIISDRKAMGLYGKNLFVEWIKCNELSFLYRHIRAIRRVEFAQNVLANGRKGIITVIGRHFLKSFSKRDMIWISPNTCGSGLRINHYGYIWIDESTRLGKNCTILPRVLLGKKSPGLTTPNILIGDGCYIGTGATILGPIIIGDNVIIAAGAIVVKDVPNNVIVAGNPARIIKHEE